ncbi:class I SAM-dependent methyltransferase [Patescibacteria group bacterium]
MVNGATTPGQMPADTPENMGAGMPAGTAATPVGVGPAEGAVSSGTPEVLEPKTLLDHVGITPGMTVADFGAGREGSFVLEAARMVSVAGSVYALDVVEEVLEVLKSMVEQAGLDNVQTIWTDLEVYGAAKAVVDNSVDVGLLITTLFQSEDKPAMFKECIRMIKPGGKLLVADWKPMDTVIGPPMDKRVSPLDARKIAEDNGLRLVEEFEPGEYYWGQIYEK